MKGPDKTNQLPREVQIMHEKIPEELRRELADLTVAYFVTLLHKSHRLKLEETTS